MFRITRYALLFLLSQLSILSSHTQSGNFGTLAVQTTRTPVIPGWPDKESDGEDFSGTAYAPLQPGSVLPSSQAINYNTSPSQLSISAVSGGNGSYTYRWYSSADNVHWDSGIPGATSAVYSPPPLTSIIYYRVGVTSNGVTLYGNSASVTVLPSTEIAVTPASQTINLVTNATSLSPTNVGRGGAGYTFQWYSSTDNIHWSAAIPGATSISYSPTGLTASTYFRVAATINGVTTYSKSGVVIVLSSDCSISGSTFVQPGDEVTYTLNDCTATSWTCSCGTVISSTSSSVTVLFNQADCSEATITAVGALAADLSVVINTGRATVKLSGSSISDFSQTININTIPASINALLVLGGPCGAGNSYQWYSSPDYIVYSPIPGATGQNYQPGALTATTNYKRVTICGSDSVYTDNIATVTVVIPASGGTIGGNTGPINFNTSPGLLGSSQDATGGSCTGNYSYQWQYSIDGTNYRNIVQATAATYTPVNLTVSTYFRRLATCGSESVNSNAIYVQVTPQRAANCTP